MEVNVDVRITPKMWRMMQKDQNLFNAVIEATGRELYRRASLDDDEDNEVLIMTVRREVKA